MTLIFCQISQSGPSESSDTFYFILFYIKDINNIFNRLSVSIILHSIMEKIKNVRRGRLGKLIDARNKLKQLGWISRGKIDKIKNNIQILTAK